jgi:predicted metalloprotease with PDZ domain
VSHADLGSFFQKYVAGTQEIAWDDFFRTVGLRLVRQTQTTADIGFQASRRFGGKAIVISVTAGGNAERAGLQAGDTIVKINGRAPRADFPQRMDGLQIGDTLRMKVQGNGGERDLQWQVGRLESVQYQLQDVENISPVQRARREAWLSGRDQPETGANE